MPYKFKRPCGHPNCPNLTNSRYCTKHQHLHKRYDPRKKMYDARWRKAREHFLKLHPLCVECLKKDLLVPATVVDHVIAHRGDINLFWDESNWQSLCERCHNSKTRTKDQHQEYKY